MTKLDRDSLELLKSVEDHLAHCEAFGQVDLILDAHDKLDQTIKAITRAYKSKGLDNPLLTQRVRDEQ